MAEDVLVVSSKEEQAEGAAVAAISRVPEAASSFGPAGAVVLKSGSPRSLQEILHLGVLMFFQIL